MTLKTFRELTGNWPDHLELMIPSTETDFKYAPVETVTRKEINFSEEPGSEPESRDEVIVLEETF